MGLLAPEDPLLLTFAGVLRVTVDPLLLGLGALRAELPPLLTVGVLRTVGLLGSESAAPPWAARGSTAPYRGRAPDRGLLRVEVPPLRTVGVPTVVPPEPEVAPPPPGFLTREEGRVTVVRGGVVVFGGVAGGRETVGFRSTVGVLLVTVPLDPVGAVLTVPVAEPEVLGIEPEGLVETVPLLRVAPVSTPGRR